MTEAAALSAQSREEWWRPTAVAVPRPVEVVPESRRSEVAFRAMLVFMFALLIAPQSFVPAFGALHLAAVAVSVAIYAHVSHAFRQHQSIFLTHPALRWAAALAGWALVTAPFSFWPGGTVSLLFGLYFKSLVIFWLLGAVVDTRLRLRKLMTWLTLLTIPIGFTAIAHFLSGSFVQGGDPSAPRIMGYDAPLTANPNDLALVMCMMLPLALALGVAARNPRARLLFFAIALLDVIAVVLTFSRTGFLTLGAMLAFAIVKLLKGTARTGAIGMVVLALCLFPLLPHGYLEHMGTITAIETDRTGSAQDRFNDSLVAAHLVLENPIVGAGAGMSVLALNEARGPSWVPVHNVYLEYATDLGLPGLVLFLLLLGACIRGVNRVVRAASRAVVRDASRASDARELYAIAGGVQLTLVAFVVAGFFHPVAYHFHFYYAAGLATALAGVSENEHARSV